MWDIIWQVAILLIAIAAIGNFIAGCVMGYRSATDDIERASQVKELNRSHLLLDTAEMYHKLGMIEEYSAIMEDIDKIQSKWKSDTEV